MYTFIAYIFTALALIASGGLIRLAYLYETVGRGLHPAICAVLVLCLLCSIIFVLWVSPELDKPEDDEQFDLTNDIFAK